MIVSAVVEGVSLAELKPVGLPFTSINRGARPMIRRFLKAIVMIPAFVVLVAWAIPNHQPVTVSFNPFDSSDPDLAVTVPLYLVAFTVLIAGVVLGGFAAWLMQSKRRRIATRLAAENVMIRAELAYLKGRTVTPEGRSQTGSANKTLPTAQLTGRG